MSAILRGREQEERVPTVYILHLCRHHTVASLEPDKTQDKTQINLKKRIDSEQRASTGAQLFSLSVFRLLNGGLCWGHKLKSRFPCFD